MLVAADFTGALIRADAGDEDTLSLCITLVVEFPSATPEYRIALVRTLSWNDETGSIVTIALRVCGAGKKIGTFVGS